MKVLYTGSFNPWHKGHQYVYDTACDCFGKENVWIGIGCNPDKIKGNPQDHLEKLKWTLIPVTNNVIYYTGLTATICLQDKFNIIVRGIRPGKSLEYEEDMMYWNMKLGMVKTIFIPTPPEINQISSSVIRELVSHGTDVDFFVNQDVYYRWKNYQDEKLKVKTNEYVYPQYYVPPTIYFGRSCVGKSTHISTIHNTNVVCNCDKDIYNFVSEGFYNDELKNRFIASMKHRFKDAISRGDIVGYYSLMADISSRIEWERLFNSAQYFDAACIGCYYDYIPKHLLGKFSFVRITTSDVNREEFIRRRNINPQWVAQLDKVYRDWPWFDREVVI